MENVEITLLISKGLAPKSEVWTSVAFPLTSETVAHNLEEEMSLPGDVAHI